MVWLPNKELNNPTMYYFLGPLYIASVLRQHNYSVELVDLRDKELDARLIPPAKFTGFSATSGEIEDARALARQLKGGGGGLNEDLGGVIHNTTTIIGGAHSTLLPENCIKDFDVVVQGEGEEVILDIMKGKTGLIKAPRILDFDKLPFPAWDLLPYDRAFSKELFPGDRYGSGQPAATIIGSRGCPYACSFCGNMLRKPVVWRSPENIVEEIKLLKEKYQIHYFRLEDDNITGNQIWLEELCRLVKPLEIKFKCHTRSDLLNGLEIDVLRDAGCEEMGIGVESADPKILKAMHKGETIEDHRRAIKLLKEGGIRSKVYLIAGLPGETEETVILNEQFMLETKPDKWTLSRFTPYPGSPIWFKPDKYDVCMNGGNFRGYWNFYSSPVYELKDVDKEILNRRYKELFLWLRIFA